MGGKKNFAQYRDRKGNKKTGDGLQFTGPTLGLIENQLQERILLGIFSKALEVKTEGAFIWDFRGAGKDYKWTIKGEKTVRFPLEPFRVGSLADWPETDIKTNSTP